MLSVLSQMQCPQVREDFQRGLVALTDRCADVKLKELDQLREIVVPSFFISSNEEPVKKRLKRARNLLTDIVNCSSKFILLDGDEISGSRTCGEWFGIISDIGSAQYWKTFPLVDKASMYTYNDTTKPCSQSASTNTVDVSRQNVATSTEVRVSSVATITEEPLAVRNKSVRSGQCYDVEPVTAVKCDTKVEVDVTLKLCNDRKNAFNKKDTVKTSNFSRSKDVYSKSKNSSLKNMKTFDMGYVGLAFADAGGGNCLANVISSTSIPQAQSSFISTFLCGWCQRKGHIERDCWRRLKLCLICGGNHHMVACVKYAPPSKLRCSNCRGEHLGKHCSKNRNV